MAELELDLLGAIRVRVDGEEKSLPASRKTRALLAYLALSPRPERRERLCELFWEIPDDPRGSLRWSLSKLRALVDTTDNKRLNADRESVQLEVPDESVDWLRLRALVRAGPEDAETDDLRDVALAGTFLEGMELQGCDEFNAWALACREDARNWRISILDELTQRSIDADEAIEFARSWTMLDPFSAKPWERLVDILRRSDRMHEAEQQRSLAIRMLEEVGGRIPSALLESAPPAPEEVRSDSRVRLSQNLRFCRSVDDAGLAYSVIGSGPPLVCAGYWMTNLENDLTSPVWRPWIEQMSARRSLLRYDVRGFGLSDRDVEMDVSLAADDLGAVVDAAGLEQFDLYGMAQGAVAAIAYAARNPERVRRLVLQSSYALGWLKRADPREVERRKATIVLATTGWNQKNQGLRTMFCGLYMPSGNDAQTRWFDGFFQSMMQHRHSSALQQALGEVDVRELAGQIKAPTLVLHSRGELIIPLAAGRETATLIPGARFVTLDTASHLIVESEPAWHRRMEAIEEFLGPEGRS